MIIQSYCSQAVHGIHVDDKNSNDKDNQCKNNISQQAVIFVGVKIQCHHYPVGQFMNTH
jgi:hypothetical protein